MKLQFLQGGLGVGGEFLEKLEAFLWMDDLDEFDFVKLVHADDASVVTTCTAGFTTEAGGVGGELDGEFVLGEDGVAVEVGDGNFGGGGEEEFVVLGAIHVVLEFGELAGAFHALAAHDVGDVDFLVSVFAGLQVEEELDEGSLEARAFSTVNGKARSRETGGVIEADEAVFFGEVDMVAWFEEGGLVTPDADDGVVLLVFSDGTCVVRDIGDVEEEVVLAFACLASFIIEGFDLLAELSLTSASMADESLTLRAEESNFF